MTKQEMIEFYQSQMNENIEHAKECQKNVKHACDEEEAFYIEKDKEHHTIIASMGKEFIRNLRELEDVK